MDSGLSGKVKKIDRLYIRSQKSVHKKGKVSNGFQVPYCQAIKQVTIIMQTNINYTKQDLPKVGNATVHSTGINADPKGEGHCLVI